MNTKLVLLAFGFLVSGAAFAQTEKTENPTPQKETTEEKVETPAPEVAPPPPSQQQAPVAATSDTDAKLEALASELNTLKEQLVIPETESKKSQYGLGPAASKVYAKTSGLSLGGYSEFYYNHPLAKDGVSGGDIYRFITYIGYKFSDHIVMNSEIEFEHATTGTNKANDEAGSVSVEFAYLDFLLHKALNFRTGLLLVPVGIINEMHEPTTYVSNLRPETEKRLIPATWREAGAGIHGELGAGLSYKLYGLNGLVGSAFGAKGVRDGRQKGNHFVAEDLGAVGRLDWRLGSLLNVGTSAYYGGADHNPTQDTEITHGIGEAHAELNIAGAMIRGLYARSWINGASDSVPTEQEGYYVDASYELKPLLGFLPGHALAPFVRYEQLNLQKSMHTGIEAQESLDTQLLTAGLQYKPHTDVVFKFDYTHNTNAVADSDAQQGLRVGAGFIF